MLHCSYGREVKLARNKSILLGQVTFNPEFSYFAEKVFSLAHVHEKNNFQSKLVWNIGYGPDQVQ
jgi:hypothetical protein